MKIMPSSNNNDKPLSRPERLKLLLLEKAGWISFLFIFIFVSAGFLIFYFKALAVVSSPSPVIQIQPPISQNNWRNILSEIERRRLEKIEPAPIIRNIFK